MRKAFFFICIATSSYCNHFVILHGLSFFNLRIFSNSFTSGLFKTSKFLLLLLLFSPTNKLLSACCWQGTLIYSSQSHSSFKFTKLVAVIDFPPVLWSLFLTPRIFSMFCTSKQACLSKRCPLASALYQLLKYPHISTF